MSETPARSPTSDPELPAPSSCARNLHLASERRGEPPEATDLCVNEAGAFHMLDCPLTWGRACALYEAAGDPRQCATETEVLSARALLNRDFLRWPYARRLKALSDGLDALPERLAIEAVPEPEERIPDELLSVEPASVEVEPVVALAPSTERYPGQRRSEDRRKRPADAPEPDTGTEEDSPPPPRTVETLFEELPEAPDVELRPKRRRRRGGSRRGGRKASGDGSQAKPGGDSTAERPQKSSSKRSRRRRKPPRNGPPPSS